MELKETRLSGETVFTGRVFTVTKDTVRLPDGGQASREVVHSSGGVVILPVDAGGNVCLVRQFRYAHGQTLLEAVAGKLEPGEEPFAAARRELREETGYTAGRWVPLGPVRTSPGFLSEVLHMYLALELTAGPQQLDRDEFLNREVYSLAALDRMIGEGRVEDGKTLAIWLRARSVLEKEGYSFGESNTGGG